MTEAIAAQLDLGFDVVGGRTVLARRHVGYPFNVTAPLRTKEPRARIIVQSVSGGLYGGDTVEQIVRAAANAQVTVRLPSATVSHTTQTGAAARHGLTLIAGAGATLQYLPRPLILFPGSLVVQTTRITAAADATILVRDGFMLHDPPSVPAAPRSLHSVLTARDAAGRLIALDRMRLADAMLAEASPGVTGGFRAFGTIWLIRRLDPAAYLDLAAAMAPLLAAQAECYAAMSALRGNGGAVLRVAAADGGALDVALDVASTRLGDLLAFPPVGLSETR